VENLIRIDAMLARDHGPPMRLAAESLRRSGAPLLRGIDLA
jgi:hypothetical protein